MVTFTTEGLSITLPTCYGDLTFEQFFKLRDLKSNKLIDALAALSGLEKSIWEQLSDLEIDSIIGPALEFLSSEFDCQNYLVPDFITISGTRYPKPKGLALNTFGQKLALQSAITEAEKEGKNSVDIYPYALALYMQPIVTGKPYDSDSVDALVLIAMKCRLSEAWPLVSFFLTSYEQYSNEKAKNYHTLLQRKKFEQELKTLKNSETFQQYSLLRKLSIKLLMMFYSRIMPRYTLPFLMSQRQISIKESIMK